MADIVEVDTNRLRQAAGDCDRIHDSIQRTLGTLRAAVAAAGTPWGNDSFGNKFAKGDKGYVAARDNLLVGIDQMASTFGEYASGQRSAADSMDAMESGNARK
ncbi:hypothetical protein [Nocardia sp. NPDC051570]|uniref:hypothetical protein n=1 Tax=Nocardia sp. NPDC051570 TaxID=3364324 RepID=UPI0037B51C79